MAKGKKKKGEGILDSGGFGWPVFGVGHHNTGPEGGWGSQDSLGGGPGDTGPIGGGTFGSQARGLGSAARFASLKPAPTKPTKPTKPSKQSKPKPKKARGDEK